MRLPLVSGSKNVMLVSGGSGLRDLGTLRTCKHFSHESGLPRTAEEGVIEKDAWVAQNPGPLTRLRVEVREPPVEHSLTVQQLRRWADRTPTSPAERIKKERLKALLAAG